MIRVFPRRTKWTPTDGLAFVGDPPLFRPEAQPVRVSVTFTWDIPEGQRLAAEWGQYYHDVSIGGPAFGDPGNEFVPGQFIKEGVVFTSRGCVRGCPFCLVPKREGWLRELPIKEGWIIQDNNLLACSKGHIEEVFDMLRRQRKAAVFAGGLDARILNEWHRTLFDSIRINELWFACDDMGCVNSLRKASNILEGIPTRKKRCYVLLGYSGESIEQAEYRLQCVYALGFLPFAQLYISERREVYTKEWRDLQRHWSRPAIYKSSAL